MLKRIRSIAEAVAPGQANNKLFLAGIAAALLLNVFLFLSSEKLSMGGISTATETQAAPQWAKELVEKISTRQEYASGDLKLVFTDKGPPAAYMDGKIYVRGDTKLENEVLGTFIAHEIGHFEQRRHGISPSTLDFGAFIAAAALMLTYFVLRTGKARAIFVGGTIALAVLLWALGLGPDYLTFRTFEIELGLAISALPAYGLLRLKSSFRAPDSFLTPISWAGLIRFLSAFAASTALYLAGWHLYNSPNRAMEVQADAFGACHTSTQAMRVGLAALRKMETPLTPLPPWWLLGQFYDSMHPTLNERIAALQEIEDQGRLKQVCSEVWAKGGDW